MHRALVEVCTAHLRFAQRTATCTCMGCLICWLRHLSFVADDTVSIVWVGSSSALIVDTILLGLIITGRPVVGVRFLVCGEY